MQRRVKDTILRMNAWGKSGRPFFFMFSYSMDDAVALPVEELEEEGILLATPAYRNCSGPVPAGTFYFRKKPVEYTRYQAAFDHVMKAINRGDTFLLNLTFPTLLETDLSLGRIFSSANARFRLKFKDDFTVFSPEPFIVISDNTIASFPMKGTRDAAIENAEEKLLKDIKEVSEHNTIVDLIRNDLSMVAKKVRVEKFRYVERIRTHERELLQTSSKITGELPADWKERVGDLFMKLLPAGSISGAPKQKTREVIAEAEGYDRGWFTGVFGLFDGSNLESAVMIRFIENNGGQLVFKSGGGITHFSDCRQEYDELVEKVYLPF